MKKKYVKILLSVLVFSLFLIVFSSVKAVGIDVKYGKSADIKKGNGGSLHPGDEVYVSFVATGDKAEKVMALYGDIEYDDSVLELVENEGNNPIVGEKWDAGSVNNSDSVFFFYTMNESRSNTIGYIKFRVKKDIKNPKNTVINVKDISIYEKFGESNYQEIPSDNENIELEVKIGNTVFGVILIIFVAVVVICAGFIVILQLKKKKDTTSIEKKAVKEQEVKDDKDTKAEEKYIVKDSKEKVKAEPKKEKTSKKISEELEEEVPDDRAEIQAKMRAMLDEVKKSKESEKKEDNSEEQNDDEKDNDKKSEE